MGPLETSRDDLRNQLSAYASQPSAAGSSGSGFGPQLLSSALGAVNPILGIIGNFISTAYSNRLSQRRAEWQNAQNIAQWQRENAYNSPSAQMQRLASAGINPALAFANGDLMNEAAQSPQLGAGQVMSPVQINPLTLAQVANLNAQTQATEHATIREDERQGLTLQTMAADLAKVNAEVTMVGSQEALNKLLGKEAAQRTENLALQWKRDNESLEDYLRDLHAKANLSVTEAHFAAERINASIESGLAYADYLKEQTKYIGYNAKTGRIEANNGTVIAETGKNKAAADIASDIRQWHLQVQMQEKTMREVQARINKIIAENKSIDSKRLGEIIQLYVKSYTDLKNANANMLNAIGQIIPG